MTVTFLVTNYLKRKENFRKMLIVTDLVSLRFQCESLEINSTALCIVLFYSFFKEER